MEGKKAQAWGFDLMIALSMFMFGIIVFYLYSLNYPSESKEKFESLQYDGNYIGDVLLSEDVNFGILSGNEIDDSKLFGLNSMGYNYLRSSFSTRNEFYFNLSVDFSYPGLGKGIGREPITYENLIKVSRFSYYHNTTVVLNIYMWN